MQHPLSAVLESQERSGSWLARRCGKSPSYVSLVIDGKRRPSHDFRTRASEALGVPESILFPTDEKDAA